MRVALDASYSVDPQPSGIAVYSHQILSGLAVAHPGDCFMHCYRPKQFRRSEAPTRNNVARRLLLPFPSFRADIFHALNQRVDRRPAGKVVSTFHDMFVFSAEYSSPDFRKRFMQQARCAAENSDLIIAVSDFTAAQVTEFTGFPRERIRVIHHGVSQPPRHLLTQESRERIVLFAGALQIRKNVSRLVAAFESLPPSWRLVLAGAPSGFRVSDILSRIHRSSAHSRIEVAGHVSREELNGLFARASIFAFPSLDEGFGIPVLEAMNFGVPVLTSNGSALAEIAGDAALLVDPHKTEEIADGLRRLTTDNDLRENLIGAGFKRAAQFTWEWAIERTYAVYRELAA